MNRHRVLLVALVLAGVSTLPAQQAGTVVLPISDAKARQAVFATIQRECATSDDVNCEVVSLYQGGKYDLYKYRRFSDVRLVFAPEFATSFFGGDPDNFMFPRYNLDLAFMRLYDGVQLAFGPTIEGGFYYDFGMEHTLTEDDFPAIEKEMARLVALDEPFERIEEPREKALATLKAITPGVIQRRFDQEVRWQHESLLKAWEAFGSHDPRWDDIVREALTLATVGLVLGLLAAFAVSESMTALLYNVRATDPATFASIAVVALVTAAAASLVPAIRALRLDPAMVVKD